MIMELRTVLSVPQVALFACTLITQVHSKNISENISFLYDEVRGDDVVVSTIYGDILGRRKRFTENVGGVTETVDHFLGIPYAEPPVGDLRFEPPKRKTQWTNTLRATRSPLVCPQILNHYNYSNEATVTEDCLYLNVYSPYENNQSDKKYPVMFYVHGGSYTAGGAVAYPARTLAQQGVVVVVINYRLGIMGFMTTGEREFPGNYGFLDIIHALSWVKETIEHFRGDRNLVTIFGNSAGGGAVGLLSVSPLARGLFKYAIAQSGSISSAWSVLRRTANVRTVTFNIGYKMGCHTNDTRDLLKCLRKIPWKRFQDYQYEKPSLSPLGLNYVPRVDGHALTEYPDAALRYQHINPEAFMTGVTKDELSRNLNYFVYSVFKDRDSTVLNEIHKGIPTYAKEKVLTSILRDSYFWNNRSIRVLLHEYTDWERPHDPLLNRDLTAQALSDLMMNAPMIKSAEMIAHREVPVYAYLFSYQEASPPYKLDGKAWWRNTSYHILDMNYVFGSVFDGVNIENGEKQSFNQDDRELSRRVMRMWVNFARTGKPTNNYAWREFEPKTSDYYDINYPHMEMRKHFGVRRMSFWNKLAYEIEDNADFMNARANVHIINPGPVPIVLVCVVVILAVLVIFLLAIIVFKHMKERKRGAKASQSTETQPAHV